jgi:hypothetical protein
MELRHLRYFVSVAEAASVSKAALRRSLPGYVEAFIDELEAYTRETFPGSHLDKAAPPVPQPPDQARVPTSRRR